MRQPSVAKNGPLAGIPNGSIHGQWGWGNGAATPSKAYCEKFYKRTIEFIDKYQPDLLYFDDTALPLWPVNDAGLHIAAHMYSSSLARHGKSPLCGRQTPASANGIMTGGYMTVRDVVEDIGKWMKVNSEAIYATRPWKLFGEGPAIENAAPVHHQRQYALRHLFRLAGEWRSNDNFCKCSRRR